MLRETKQEKLRFAEILETLAAEGSHSPEFFIVAPLSSHFCPSSGNSVFFNDLGKCFSEMKIRPSSYFTYTSDISGPFADGALRASGVSRISADGEARLLVSTSKGPFVKENSIDGGSRRVSLLSIVMTKTTSAVSGRRSVLARPKGTLGEPREGGQTISPAADLTGMVQSLFAHTTRRIMKHQANIAASQRLLVPA